MIIVSNRIPVNPDYRDAFEERFMNRASQVDQMEGFIAFQLLRPTNEGEPYIVMTYWETRAHFDAWTNSEDFKDGHKQSSTLPKETFLGRPQLEVHEVIQNTLGVAQIIDSTE